MTLGELIERLSREDATQAVPRGWTHPHSYRGYYEQLAFEPCGESTVGGLLDVAKSALGQTYTGYKGGNYEMGEYTDVWLADYGSTGDEITDAMLDAMLSAGELAELRVSLAAAEARIEELEAELDDAEVEGE